MSTPGYDLGIVIGRLGAAVSDWCAGIVAGARSVEAARIAAYEAEVKAIVAVARRRRLAAFEASDPAGRLAEMDARHRAEAARLRAEYPEVVR